MKICNVSTLFLIYVIVSFWGEKEGPLIFLILLRVGSARARSRPGPLSATWAAGLSWSRNFICGPHRNELAWAGPRVERSFSLFFYPKTVKNTKIQHKTWAGPRAREQIFKISSPTWHGPPLMGLGLTRHLLKPAGRAREQARILIGNACKYAITPLKASRNNMVDNCYMHHVWCYILSPFRIKCNKFIFTHIETLFSPQIFIITYN